MDNIQRLEERKEFEKWVNEFFQSHKGYTENEIMHLSILCDSTIFFLGQMVQFLEAIGCTDIQTDGYVENDGLYGYRFKASGKMPKGMVISEINE